MLPISLGTILCFLLLQSVKIRPVTSKTGSSRPWKFVGNNRDDYVLPVNSMAEWSEFTLAVWVKQLATNPQWNSIFGYTVGDADYFWLGTWYDGSIGLAVGDTQASEYPPISLNEWHQLMLTWRRADGDTRFYMDGVEVLSETIAAGFTAPLGGCLALSQDPDDNCNAAEFDTDQAWIGYMSDPQLFSVVLDADQRDVVLNHCRLQTCEEGEGLHCPSEHQLCGDVFGCSETDFRAYGSVERTEEPCLHRSEVSVPWYFPGISGFECLRAKHPFPSLSAFTISVWAKRPLTLPSDPEQYVFSYNIGNSDLIEFNLKNGGEVNYGVPPGSLTTVATTSGQAEGDWHHYVVTWRAADGDMTLYIDGVLIVQGTGPTSDINGGGCFLVGQEQDEAFDYSENDADQAFEGYVADFHLFDSVLTAGQIDQVFSQCSLSTCSGATLTSLTCPAQPVLCGTVLGCDSTAWTITGLVHHRQQKCPGSGTKYRRVGGQYSSLTPLTTGRVRGWAECGARCQSVSQCSAFNYHTTTGDCHLLALGNTSMTVDGTIDHYYLK